MIRTGVKNNGAGPGSSHQKETTMTNQDDNTQASPGMRELQRHTQICQSTEHKAITEFFDWLLEHNYTIAEIDDDGYDFDGRTFVTEVDNPVPLFAQYHGIDLDLVEDGRQELLMNLRQRNNN